MYPPPRLWGSEFLCPLSLFILFPGRWVSCLPFLLLLKYFHSWCLISFLSQITLTSRSPFLPCCFWGRNIASLMLSRGQYMVPHFFMLNEVIFVPTFIIYKSQCCSLCFHNLFVCCLLCQLAQFSFLVFLEEYYIYLSEFSNLLIIRCRWVLSYS